MISCTYSLHYNLFLKDNLLCPLANTKIFPQRAKSCKALFLFFFLINHRLVYFPCSFKDRTLERYSGKCSITVINPHAVKVSKQKFINKTVSRLFSCFRLFFCFFQYSVCFSWRLSDCALFVSLFFIYGNQCVCLQHCHCTLCFGDSQNVFDCSVLQHLVWCTLWFWFFETT